MSGSLLEAAFAHHVWATARVIDGCLDLSVDELEPSSSARVGRCSRRFATSTQRRDFGLDTGRIVEKMPDA
jgi:hypothetical protein